MKAKQIRTLRAELRAREFSRGISVSRGIRSLLLVTLIVGGTPLTALSQEDISQKRIPSLELQQADVREALRTLFNNVGVSYSIAPEVQGSVTAKLENVSFETAMQNILRQVDATYRVEGGVYEIVRRQETVAPVPTESAAPSVKTTVIRRIRIRSADPMFIAAMIGAKQGSQSYTISPELSTIARGSSSSGSGNRSGRSGGSGGFGSGSSGFGSGSSGFGSGSSGFGSGSSGGFGGGTGSRG